MTLEQIDLTDLDFFVHGDMYEAFKLLRTHEPVHWQERKPGRGFWSLTRYDDVLAAYKDVRNFSSALGVSLYFGRPQPDRSGMGRTMILTDPPRHAKIRQVVSRRFTPRAVAAYEGRIRQIAADVIDSMAEQGGCDFVVDIAARLPTAAICDMMGIEREHWDLMFAIANQSVGRHDDEYAMGRSGRETMLDAQAQASEFFVKEAEKRRRNPTDDLISVLVHGEAGDEPLTDAEVIANCWLLILGGQETTRNAISGAMLALAQHPAEREKFLADPLAPAAIEEFLRWTSPVTHIMRTAMSDMRIRGESIRTGDRVVLWNAAANRDEARFDNPDTFDVGRAPNEHLAFGYGEHFCLGAHLARLEMKVLFEELVRRVSDIEIAGPIERLRSNFVAGIKHMPVRFVSNAMPEPKPVSAA
jgi:cytochrome P450